LFFIYLVSSVQDMCNALVWKHATTDISDEQEQSVKRMRFVTGQCFDFTWYFYCDWHWTYYYWSM